MNSNQEQIDMFGYTTNEAVKLIEVEHNLIEQKKRMLNGMVSFFSLESKHNDFQRSFIHKVREFFSDGLRRTLNYSWAVTIEDLVGYNIFNKTEEIDELDIAILGCHIPLNTSAIITKKLLNYESSNFLFNNLISVQIKEPLKEKELIKTIESIDEIDDVVSKKVKKQY